MGNKFESQGQVLKKFRKECGFTNKEVVDRVGKSPMWLSDIENGKSNLFFKDAKKLCHIYGHTLDEFSELIDNYEK